MRGIPKNRTMLHILVMYLQGIKLVSFKSNHRYCKINTSSLNMQDEKQLTLKMKVSKAGEASRNETKDK